MPVVTWFVILTVCMLCAPDSRLTNPVLLTICACMICFLETFLHMPSISIEIALAADAGFPEVVCGHWCTLIHPGEAGTMEHGGTCATESMGAQPVLS